MFHLPVLTPILALLATIARLPVISALPAASSEMADAALPLNQRDGSYGHSHPPKITAADVINELGLVPNVEKGYYIQTFIDPATYNGTRSFSTAIYYLLEGTEGWSYWHHVDTVEVWHWYGGAPLHLGLSWNNGTPTEIVTLGPDIFHGQRPQYPIPKWRFQHAKSLGDWTLVGTTVAPGFSPNGFELEPPGWEPKSS